MLAAKLSLPHTGFILRRPRVTSLLEPMKSGGVVTLVAGGGYGKTSLIVDLLSSATGRTVYYSLDEGDQDPLRFLTYLLAGLGIDPSKWTSDGSADTTASGMQYAALDVTGMIVDHMSAHAGESTFIAIDDFHLVDTSPGVLSSLSLIIRSLPPNWTVLISSRRRVPLALDSLSLGGRVTKIQGRQLRLTPREVAAWTAHNWNLELQTAEARALWRLTEGWPAALVLLGRRLLSTAGSIGHETLAAALAQGGELQHYLEQDILGGLEPLAAETMMTAALLPRVVFPRDEELLPGAPGDAETLLEEFVSEGFLVTRNGRRTYTIHPLVREFVLRDAGTIDRTGRLVFTAQHLENVGERGQAVELYLRLGRFDDASRQIRALTMELPDSSMTQAQEDWLAFIPDAAVAEPPPFPWLLVAKAQIRQKQGGFVAATTLYDEAAAAVASSGDSDGLLPILLASAYCLIRQRHWEDALGVLQRCRVLTRTWNDELGVLLAESMILNAMCRWDEADESYEKCLAHLPPGSQSVAARQRICTHRGVMTFRLGQYHVCKKWLQKSLAYGAEASPFGYCSALANTAGCAMLLGEYDRAANVAEDCHRIIRAKGYAFLEPWWMLCQGIIAEGAFNYHEAAKCFKEARNVAAKYGTPDDRFWADVRLGDVRRHEGDAESALEHHRTALDKVRGNRFGMFEQIMTQLSVGADLALIKDRGAGKAISEATALARKYGFLASLSLGLLYLGWLQIQNGRTEDGANTLREAMWIAEENGHIHFFAQESSVAMPILALCDRLGAGSSFIRTALVPRLPAALQTYFAKLTEADTDPATMPLGRPRPRRRKQSEITAAAAEKAALEPIQSLTEREREILSMLSQGLANKVIAGSLSITEGTVKVHVNHILKKLGVTNRFQAILVFREHN